VILAAASGPFFGAFAGAAAIAGGVAAMCMNAWHTRHPSVLPSPSHARVPEINFSSVTVGGDVGGLIVVAGSVAIVIAGLPGVRWYLLGAVATGLLFAAVLVAWRGRRPALPRSGPALNRL
jgi:hypothetical protein